METVDLAVLSRFESVWERVRNGNGQSERPSYTWVEDIMDGLCLLQQGSLQLASHACGNDKKRLLTQANALKYRCKRLQLFYFLVTGDLHFASQRANFASYTPYNLRKLWQITVEKADLLKNCNLHESMNFAAELGQTQALLERQRLLLEDLLEKLLR